MQKETALLFSNETDTLIHGIDLTFRTGDAATTLESIDKFTRENPGALSDAKMLSSIEQSSTSLVSQMEQPKNLEEGSLELFNSVKNWCRVNQILPLSVPDLHAPEFRRDVQQSLDFLQSTCMSLNSFQWTVKTPTEVSILLTSFYWSLSKVRDYYRLLRTDLKDTLLSKIVKTWESFKYFEKLKTTFDEYRDTTAGNQARLNYYDLTKRLGDTLVESTFAGIMKSNHAALTKHRWFRKEPIHSVAFRQRAFHAMIAACQSLDPTLVSFFPDLPEDSKLFQQWQKHCVGPKSTLCKDVIGKPFENKLLGKQNSRMYVNSLCGKRQIAEDLEKRSERQKEEYKVGT
jgi:hypothetical protein